MQPLIYKLISNVPKGVAGMQGEDTNLWLDKAQLILKLQQAKKLLTAQSDLIDGTFLIFLIQKGKPHAVLQFHISYYCPWPSHFTIQNRCLQINLHR